MTCRLIANNIPHKLVDGNDVCSIYHAAKEQVAEMRQGKGPRFIELVTYRHYGHVDWRDDIDVGVERSLEDVKNWKARVNFQVITGNDSGRTVDCEDEDDFMEKLDTEIRYLGQSYE